MRTFTVILAAAAITILAGPAYASCVDEVAQLDSKIKHGPAGDVAQAKKDLARARTSLRSHSELECHDAVSRGYKSLRAPVIPKDKPKDGAPTKP